MPVKKPINWKMLGKMTTVGLLCCIGGPTLVVYVSPTPEELFSRYNPDLQKRSLENRDKKQQDFDDFVMRLREYSKNERPIWLVMDEAEKKEREAKREKVRKQWEEEINSQNTR